MSPDQDVLVEHNGTILALVAADAQAFLSDQVLVPCSTCEPPCGYYHVSPDRVADPVIALGRPVSGSRGRARPIATFQSERR